MKPLDQAYVVRLTDHDLEGREHFAYLDGFRGGITNPVFISDLKEIDPYIDADRAKMAAKECREAGYKDVDVCIVEFNDEGENVLVGPTAKRALSSRR